MSGDGKRVVVVATLDNLLKGAATQAMQNINRAIGVDEYTAIPSVKAGVGDWVARARLRTLLQPETSNTAHRLPILQTPFEPWP